MSATKIPADPAAVGGGIPSTIVDAKGDLIGATADNTPARIPVGTNGQIFKPDSSASLGVAWGFDTPPVHAVGNSGSSLTINPTVTGPIKTITLTANCTFTFTGATSGLASVLELVLTQDATGSRIVTWGSSVKWSGGPPVLSTAANAVDRVGLISYNGGTTWYGSFIGKGYA